MGDPTSRRKTYKLKDPITRDSFNTWDLNHRAFCRQDAEWTKFLPGGTRDRWTAFSVDKTRGLTLTKRQGGEDVLDEAATNKIRASLEDFLVILGTFLGLDDMNLTFGADGVTYQQGFQAIREFYCSSLLKEGERFNERVLTADEVLTPLACNMICEKWLNKIDPV